MHAEELDLAFVVDDEIRTVLEDYYSQTRKAAEAHSYLGVLVGCGSVVEGLLTWALLRREQEAMASPRASKDKAGNLRPLREWPLASLIDVSIQLDLLGKTASQASWALKDFRNFIHPYNVLQQSARPTLPLAASALAVVAEIRRSLHSHLEQ